MRTLRAAAALLARADSADALVPVAAAIGCDGAPLSLGAEATAALRLPPELRDARVARGPGALRALLATVDTSGAALPLREVVSRTASRLAAKAPHLLWAVIVAERSGHNTAIAAWAGDRAPPRVAALVADRRRVVDSDAETLCALAAARDGSDVLTHARWLDVLGRESLTRRFYRALERVVHDLADAAHGAAPISDRRELALLYVSRLLFLAFLEAKGWLDGDRDFLARGYARCMEGPGGYQRRVLLPLFFGTLNTPARARAAAARAFGRVPFLNGGLFAPTPLERRFPRDTFPDEPFGRVFGDLLARYRFTAREDRASWSEAAIDPEMLGRAFESLMGATVRRASGAFYTPQVLVARATAAALADALGSRAVSAEAAAGALRGELPPAEACAALRERLAGLRVLDPACGSGAFLVHALEELSALAARLGDSRGPSAVRREVLARSIFGVDINPTAVWLCELRLWLSVVIDSPEADPLRVPPLPNLDRHIRLGDALAGGGFEDTAGSRAEAAARELAGLRARYARAAGPRKRTLALALDRAERARARATLEAALGRAAHRRRELVAAARARDLFGDRPRPGASERAQLQAARAEVRSLRSRRRALADGAALPFSFAAHFADAALSGGFDVVVGNPPWVRLREIPPATRAALRGEFTVVRNAAWARGAALASAGPGFAAQVDLAAPFVERALRLLRPDGTLALLVPAKLWRALAGGGVRRLLATDARLLALEDWSESRHTFDAAVYPSLLVARRASHDRRAAHVSSARSGQLELARAPTGGVASESDRQLAAAVHRGSRALEWRMRAGALPLDEAPESPWLLAPPEVRAAFDRVAAAGVPLAESAIGRPTLGVKCGCNEAFVVTLAAGEGLDARGLGSERSSRCDRALVRVRAGNHEGFVEHGMLRPLVRGTTLGRWRSPDTGEYVVWTHADDGRPRSRLPQHAERWLVPWRDRLERRADRKRRGAWWALFRVESASASLPRVVWSDFGRAPRAAVLPAGDRTVALNSCYVARCAELEDADALAALLNGPLAAAWLNAIAEPARGGYHRYLGWTVSLLPLPRDWPAARRELTPLARRARAGEAVRAGDLLAAALAVYGVPEADVAPLLAWSGH